MPVPGDFGQAKVGYFGPAVVQKHVRRLQVAVDDLHLTQIEQSLADVRDIAANVSLMETIFLPDLIGQIALVAQLRDDVAIAVAHQRLMEAEDVGVVHLLQYAYFFKDQRLQLLGLERVQRNYLNGHCLLCVKAQLLVFSLVPLYTLAKLPLPMISL